MPTSYPGALDTLTNPVDADPLDSPNHAEQHENANDAVEAIQTELGVNPQGSYADVDARIAALEPLVQANYSTNGLSYTHIGNTTSGGGSTITLNKPVGTADGDLLIIVAAGHNATVSGPSGSNWKTMVAYDTDGTEPIYCYTKIASGEGASWTLSTSSSNVSITGAAVCVIRGPTVRVNTLTVDASLVTHSAMTGVANGVAIGVWLSALCAATAITAPGSMTQLLSFRVAASQPAFCIGIAPTTHAFSTGTFTAAASGISGTWLGNIIMVWK